GRSLVMWSPAEDRLLAQRLLAAVRAHDFGNTADSLRGGAPLAHFPSLDLAVVRFAPGAAPCCANVLFSREHPHGLVAEMSGKSGSVGNLRFDADLQGADGESVAWLPDADWQQLPFKTLQAASMATGHRFVAPYPASLLKLMVAVGVGLAVDRGLCDWPDALMPMIVDSDNEATEVCVALLHRLRMVAALNDRLAELGLGTLQLNNTRADGGWRNADGAGVGHIHMTAWDSVRLLWLLDVDAPPPPWLPPDTRLLQPATRDHLRSVLRQQRWDHVLSSGSLRGSPGWVAGLPDAPTFAHKTGSTDNYASDAGIVQTPDCHYIVALLTSLGKRYAPTEGCATTWRVPALGAALHTMMETLP
ncbi:MAG TPA: serine hydrolase, partial [Rubrivivax sp.]|nr:serine hydrolase [Rubrivivax sp.]